MSMSFLWDMWDNKPKVLEGLLGTFNKPTQEVELGAPWNREVAGHNIPVDVGQIGTGIFEMIKHPVVTGDTALNLLSGAVGKLLPEPVMDVVDWADKKLGFYEQQQENEAMASEAWEGIVATHGGVDELKKYANEHPVLMAWELSGLGLLASQVVKRLSPAVVRAMEDIEARGLLENVINKQTSSVLSGNQGLMDKTINQIMAYHGNPDAKRFRNFDFDRIGTGMGLQKEAWGINASAQEGTAVKFAGTTGDADLSRAYRHKLDTKYLTTIERDIWGQAEWGHLPKNIKKRMYEKYPDKKSEIDTVMKELEKMHDKSSAQIYDLDIHDDAILKMISQEKTMVQQPLEVQALARKWKVPSTMTGREFYDVLAEHFAVEMGGEGARKTTSLYLAENGIPGMQYLDDMAEQYTMEGSTMVAKDPPLYSYVLFDNKSHTMLNRQGKPIDEVKLISESYAQPRIVDQRNIIEGVLDPNLLQAKITDIAQPMGFSQKLNVADLVDRPWLGTISDTSRASGHLEGILGTDFLNRVRFRGGGGYMFDEPNWLEGRIWEMGKTQRQALLNTIEEARKLNPDKAPILLPTTMKGTGIDFSHQVTDTMLQSARANLNKTQIKKLDDYIRKESKDVETNKKVNQNWKGANSENPLEGTTGAERKEIARIIDKYFREVEGVTSRPEARLINVDPAQLNKEPLTLMNVAQIAKDPVGTTSSHPSYGYSIMGEPLGTLMEDIHLLDLMPDAKKKGGELMTKENMTDADYRKLTMQQNYGLLTEDILRMLDDQGKLYGGLLK